MNRSRSTVVRVAGQMLGREIERDGGRITGRVVLIVIGVLAVAGLAFVAYRLLVLNLILDVLRERG